MSATTFGWLILLFPLLGTVLVGLGYPRLSATAAGWLATLMVGLSFAASVAALISLLGDTESHRQLTSSLWIYAVSTGLDAQLSILVDPLSVFMVLVVSGVSTLIHVYAVAYMKSD